jgi:2-dehydropantoate 2-reductase
MRICVVGAGAIGGLLAVKLSAAGAKVSVVIRGAHLQAVRTAGLKLIEADEEIVQSMPAAEHIAELGPQDVLILALKAHQLVPIIDEVAAAISPETCVVTAQNGIPWWYFQKSGGPYEGTRLESVDPGGVISGKVPVSAILGSVVYAACDLIAPGVIRHIEGNRFPLGEIDGSTTPRLRALVEVFRQAGFKSPVMDDIRSDIWLKLWGNLCFNPISALTHATLQDICRFPRTRALAATMMTEAQSIGEKLGVRFKLSLEKRIAVAEAVGAHKTSMLQDIEHGRAMELEALVGSVIELGRITQTPTPTIEVVYALATLLSQSLQTQRGRLHIVPT